MPFPFPLKALVNSGHEYLAPVAVSEAFKFAGAQQGIAFADSDIEHLKGFGGGHY
jgi:hypothetical protein